MAKLPMNLSKRCGAKTRAGGVCNHPAMKNGRCRFHGGLSTGAPKGSANGAYKHGLYTCEAVATRRMLAALRRSARQAIQSIE